MRKRTAYKIVKDGGSFELPDGVPHKIVCCDCGLVHILEPHHSRKLRATVITVRRDERATGQRRRYMKKKDVPA
jgi:hypothetical protein